MVAVCPAGPGVVGGLWWLRLRPLFFAERVVEAGPPHLVAAWKSHVANLSVSALYIV